MLILTIIPRIGAITERRSFILLFARVLLLHNALHLVSASINLYSLYNTNQAELIQKCLDHANKVANDPDPGNSAQDSCQKAFVIGKYLITAIFAVVSLIEICAPFCVFR